MAGWGGYRVLEVVVAVLADVDLCIPSPFSAPLRRSARINAAMMRSTTMAIPIGVRHLVAHFIIGSSLGAACSTPWQ
jgi:hypothetical protein